MPRSVARRAARLALLCLPLLAVSCTTEVPSPPVRSYPALRYDYLTKLRLNVAAIEVVDRAVHGSPADISELSPVTPLQALTAMAQDRLVAAGGTGRAVFRIDQASILRSGDTLTGHLAVHLEVTTDDGHSAGYAEARVTRVQTLSSGADLRDAAYTMTRQMMDDMNVEFEYQVRRSLKDWLIQGPPGAGAPAATPAPVQQQALPPPR